MNNCGWNKSLPASNKSLKSLPTKNKPLNSLPTNTKFISTLPNIPHCPINCLIEILDSDELMLRPGETQVIDFRYNITSEKPHKIDVAFYGSLEDINNFENRLTDRLPKVVIEPEVLISNNFTDNTGKITVTMPLFYLHPQYYSLIYVY